MWRWPISIAFCVVLAMSTFSQSVGTEDIGLLAKVESGLISWFDQLSSSVDQIADSEDRRRIRAALQKLQGSIYEVETSGRNLVTTLETTPLNQHEARKAVGSTRTAVANLEVQLHSTGLVLRNQDRAGGAQVEEMIAEAIGKRTVWLSDVDREITNRQISGKTIREGQEILGHQRTASIALGIVIEKLAQQ